MENRKNQQERRSATIENGAYLLVGNDGAIQYMGGETADWLKKFFSNEQPEGFVPRRLHRWLKEEKKPRGAGALSARRDDARLFVTMLRPRTTQSTALLLEVMSNGSGRAARHKELSLRQNDVWRWLAAAKTNAEIAVILGIKAATVARHVEQILERLGVENRTGAAALYHELRAGRNG